MLIWRQYVYEVGYVDLGLRSGREEVVVNSSGSYVIVLEECIEVVEVRIYKRFLRNIGIFQGGMKVYLGWRLRVQIGDLGMDGDKGWIFKILYRVIVRQFRIIGKGMYYVNLVV